MKTAYMGLFLAFALILSYIETLIPFAPGIPGIKLGLANMAVILCLYLFGFKYAFLLTTVKAILAGLMFGNMFMIVYSLAGAWFSLLLMAALKRYDVFHMPIVSACGGIMHNMGQLLVAFFAVETYAVIYYMPILVAAGLLTGTVIGMAASLVLPYIQKILVKGATL